MTSRTRTLAYRWLAVVVISATASSACHEEGDVRVASLTFEGNKAFSSSRLSDVIVTQPTGWLPWARPRFFNRAVFDADLARITAFYDDRGYPDARVTSTDVIFNEKRDAVRLRIHIDEAEPLIVERVAFTGLDQAPPEVTGALESVPLRAGMPRDRQLVAATRERVTFLLHDRGYPHARVESRGVRRDTAEARRRDHRRDAGRGRRRSATSPWSVSPSVHEILVRRTLAFEAGELYRESLLLRVSAGCGKLGIFEFAHVRNDPQAEVAVDGRPGCRWS